ncbi:hypothetical protein NDU88_002794 [Pleurodeles waltl]|uniref:Uncharacterized protein n=1 Tax=Pleurodeles waltl TaxID=8319 RepID=A0AAV7RF06_PLEWA|nr:hypothetical protein NDU88_002794 [Pleurodeles waltl]
MADKIHETLNRVTESVNLLTNVMSVPPDNLLSLRGKGFQYTHCEKRRSGLWTYPPGRETACKRGETIPEHLRMSRTRKSAARGGHVYLFYAGQLPGFTICGNGVDPSEEASATARLMEAVPGLVCALLWLRQSTS